MRFHRCSESLVNRFLDPPILGISMYSGAHVFDTDHSHKIGDYFLINFQQHMHSICVWNMIKQSKPLQTRCNTRYIHDRYYIRTYVYVFLFSVKNACFNYREFDLEDVPVGVPHTWYFSAMSFITLLELV